MKNSSYKSIIEIFDQVPDPHNSDYCPYPQSSLLFIALSTLLSNGEDYVDMESFARERQDWISTKVEQMLKSLKKRRFTISLNVVHPEEILKI